MTEDSPKHYYNPKNKCGVLARLTIPIDRACLVQRLLRTQLVVNWQDDTYHSKWGDNVLMLLSRIVVREERQRGPDHLLQLEQIVDQANSCLKSESQPQFEIEAGAFHTSPSLTNMTNPQLIALKRAIVGSGAPLAMRAPGETADFIARDATIVREEWESLMGIHVDPTSGLRIQPTKLFIYGKGNVAALDTELYTVPAAVEQTLIDEDTGTYAYVPNSSTCYVVYVYHPQHVDLVESLALAAGFNSSKTEPIKLTWKQLFNWTAIAQRSRQLWHREFPRSKRPLVEHESVSLS